MIISKYTYLFEHCQEHFIFNSRTNSFYCISKELYTFFASKKDDKSIDGGEVNDEVYAFLKDRKLIVEEEEDQRYLDFLKLSFLTSSFSCNSLGLTILPTISCNLRCPYCFEDKKPTGMMNEDVIDEIIKFIKRKSVSKKYNITWFGGEPLLGLNVIESALEKMHALEEYECISHNLITNGTLLNSKAIDVFKRFPLSSIQITLDGEKSTHDSKRFNLNKEGTFDLIIDNAFQFINALPNTRIDFRVNVDKYNKLEYIKLHSFLLNKFKGKNISVYPGILRATTGCETENFFSSEDHLAFSKMLWDHNLESLYPSHCSKGCCATSMYQYVIGPRGELYLCWEHVGKRDKILGYLDGSSGSKSNEFSLFKLKGSCFDDAVCLDCWLLPICSGGCADKRIQNIKGSKHNLCCKYNENNHEGLNEALYRYYKTTHSK